MMTLAVFALIGYLLGALPFGYLVARRHGINIFEHGSKNPGATNVRRVLGKGPGNLVFALDAGKGALAAGLPMWWQSGAAGLASPGSLAMESAIVGLVAALLGHSFSCFTRFRGGKGVATTVGGFLVLLPWVLLIAAVVWAATFYSSRYVSLASILAAVALPVGCLVLREPPLLGWISAAIAAFVVIRHRTNLVRLLNGTESKFVKKTGAGS